MKSVALNDGLPPCSLKRLACDVIWDLEVILIVGFLVSKTACVYFKLAWNVVLIVLLRCPY